MAIHGPLGRRLVGKTTFADYLCRQCTYQIRFSPRVTLPHRKGGTTMGAVPSGEVFTTIMALQGPPGPGVKGGTLTIVPDHDVIETFIALTGQVRRWYIRQEAGLVERRETVGFIIDEARFLNRMKQQELADLDWLFRCTRPEVMHFYLTVHRPKDLHPDIRAILDHWYVFHVTQQRDLEILADECTPLIAARAETLKPREFYHFNVGTQQAYHWPPTKAATWAPEDKPLERDQMVTMGQLEEAADDDWGLT